MFTGYMKIQALGKEVHSRHWIISSCMDRGGLGGGEVGVRMGHTESAQRNLKENGLGEGVRCGTHK